MVVNPANLIRKLVSLPPALLARIEDFRFENRVKTESEAIRILIERGLAAPNTAPSQAD